MGTSRHPLRRIGLAALVGLASIANAPRLAVASLSGRAAPCKRVWEMAYTGGVPFVSRVAGGATRDTPRSDRLADVPCHTHAAERGGVGAVVGPTLAEVKAAFLYNFTKFTEWPADALPPVATLGVCIADGSTVQTAIQEITKGAVVRGHPLIVRQAKRDGPFDGCHLLYVEGLNEKSALQMLDKLHGAPVLSVSDLNGFAQLGGGAHLFIEDGRMRFAVNLEATRRIQLRLSAVFLSLAKIVTDDPNHPAR